MAPRKNKRRRQQQPEHNSNLDEPNGPLEIFRSAPILPLPTSRARQSEVNLQRKALYPGRVWVVENFLNASECAAWVAHGERIGFDNVSHPATYEMAFRDNGRIECTETLVAANIWQRLCRMLPNGVANGRPVACHSKIRVYRYERGQRFGMHVDQSDELNDGTSTGATVLIYLNDEGLQGGETVFYKDHDGKRVAVKFKPKRGALLFHGHGSRCLTHEASEVVRGAKYVLRTDVVFDTRLEA